MNPRRESAGWVALAVLLVASVWLLWRYHADQRDALRELRDHRAYVRARHDRMERILLARAEALVRIGVAVGVPRGEMEALLAPATDGAVQADLP
jgi:hypothetical protein